MLSLFFVIELVEETPDVLAPEFVLEPPLEELLDAADSADFLISSC
jgi:hypothetical protein